MRSIRNLLTGLALVAGFSFATTAPLSAQDVEDDTYQEADDDDGGFDLGWLGLLGLLGLLGRRKHPEVVHTHTTHAHNPPPPPPPPTGGTYGSTGTGGTGPRI